MEKPAGHFQTLDALRGIAALAVMVFHAPRLGVHVMPGGYLAVDLFFMLSGAVIAHAYHQRMADGMTFRQFLVRRTIRLWPALAIGAMLGIALHGGRAGLLILLPNMKTAGSLFPANPPLWSLFMEALAYIAFALGLWRCGPRLLLAIAIACGFTLTVLALESPYFIIDFGAHWPTVGGGLARVGFGFCVGMAIWHIWNLKGAPRISGNHGWVLGALLLATMTLNSPPDQFSALLAILLIFPVITWLALCWEIPQARVARTLGDLSYPLYCIHMPVLLWFAPSFTTSLVLCIALPIVALCAERWIERPARGWLTAQFRRERDQTRIGIST